MLQHTIPYMVYVDLTFIYIWREYYVHKSIHVYIYICMYVYIYTTTYGSFSFVSRLSRAGGSQLNGLREETYKREELRPPLWGPIRNEKPPYIPQNNYASLMEHIYTYIVFSCTYIYVCMTICIHVYVCVYICVYVYIRVYVYIYMYICVCMYIYIDMYIYIYMYMHVYTCVIPTSDY